MRGLMQQRPGGKYDSFMVNGIRVLIDSKIRARYKSRTIKAVEKNFDVRDNVDCVIAFPRGSGGYSVSTYGLVPENMDKSWYVGGVF